MQKNGKKMGSQLTTVHDKERLSKKRKEIKTRLNHRRVNFKKGRETESEQVTRNLNPSGQRSLSLVKERKKSKRQ